jgi:pyocin large subunit-like protein
MVTEAYNKTVAVILADWYGGNGCGIEQLKDLAESIRRCIKTAQDDGRHIPVGVIISSGEGSPVDRNTASEMLREAGADVFFSADEAAEYVRLIIG